MTLRSWLFTVPLLGLMGGGIWVAKGGQAVDRPFASPEVLQIERETGRHVYTPGWLPAGGRLGRNGVIQGAHRLLQDFTDDSERALLILAQEPRDAERDRYNDRVFVKRADARTDVNGQIAYYVTGSGGERRLYWNLDATSVILSSSVLNDEDLALIARKVR